MGKNKKRASWDATSISALRKHLGLSQQALADELGARQQTISEWETGQYRPRGLSAAALTRIADLAQFVSYRADEPASDELPSSSSGLQAGETDGADGE
ncbi:MAG: helix-turn-helix transcriptional regulator [Dehalococcoidia bacterium]